MAQKLKHKDEFDRELRLEALRIRRNLNEVNSNTFVPLVLFNRDEVVRILRDSKDDLTRLRKMI